MQFVGPTALRQPRGSITGGLRWPSANPLASARVTLSADDTRVAADVFDERAGAHDIWVVDVEQGVASRVTADPAYEGEPTWAPDGNRLAFVRQLQDGFQIVEKALTTGAERIMFESPN